MLLLMEGCHSEEKLYNEALILAFNLWWFDKTWLMSTYFKNADVHLKFTFCLVMKSTCINIIPANNVALIQENYAMKRCISSYSWTSFKYLNWFNFSRLWKNRRNHWYFLFVFQQFSIGNKKIDIFARQKRCAISTICINSQKITKCGRIS